MTVLLTTAEVARRLGVRPATVYAYVSRGFLRSRRNADGKASLFAKPEVDAFVASRRRPGTPGVRTGITLIRDGGLYYRGWDALELAESTPFEAVASLLWTGSADPLPFTPDPAALPTARAVARALPPRVPLTARLRVIVAAAAALPSPDAVATAGRTLLGTVAAALPARRTEAGGGFGRVLWSRLSSRTPEARDLSALNAALVLLADHDLAASTLAARVAASTRAHPYAVVAAGLAALDGPLHGAASALARRTLTTATVPGTAPLSGFDHPLYPDGDPRATALLALLPDGPVRDRCTTLIADVAHSQGSHPNVDLALAAFTLHHDMPDDAGEVIFALARTAGWLAHALEEYEARPSRFRPTGDYAGRLPTPGTP